MKGQKIEKYGQKTPNFGQSLPNMCIEETCDGRPSNLNNFFIQQDIFIRQDIFIP